MMDSILYSAYIVPSREYKRFYRFKYLNICLKTLLKRLLIESVIAISISLQ